MIMRAFAFRALAVGALSLVTLSSETLVKRKLGDVAVIDLPRSIKEEMYMGARTEQLGRLVFTFNTTYFWASFMAPTRYKQLLCVSIMAPDASDDDYAAQPRLFDVSYDHRKRVRQVRIGSGTLDMFEGIYEKGTEKEPAGMYLYADRARRLQIVWHATKEVIKFDDVPALMGKMVASFAITNEPTAAFNEMRDRPMNEAKARAKLRATAIAMLAREGYTELTPGKPVLKDGMYFEWMVDPEPRFQLLIPLGTVKATPNVMGGMRPRPASLRNADGTLRELPGSVGWWDFWEGEWGFHNSDNAYLPMHGIGELLSAKYRDPAMVFFYFSGTVRVEETTEAALTDLRWFRDAVPQVQQLWREGRLIRGAMDEAPFPIRKE